MFNLIWERTSYSVPDFFLFALFITKTYINNLKKLNINIFKLIITF